MDRHNDWRESDCTFFDASCTSDNEWNADTTAREDQAASAFAPSATADKSDALPSAKEGRIMVIGFSVIRV